MSSVMWNFFKKVENGGTCKICSLFVKTCGNTTNLKQHLKRKHPSVNVNTTFFSKSAKMATTTDEFVEHDEDDALFVQSVVIFIINYKKYFNYITMPYNNFYGYNNL